MSNLGTPVVLKWSKQTFPMTIEATGESAVSFKRRVETLTGVPMPRQKLLAKKGGWKGPLKDDFTLDSAILPSPLTITLIGSAETLAAPKERTTFIEDMTPEQRQAADDAIAQEAMKTAKGMITTLQLPAHHRDDGKQEFYTYNRLVTGLPQRQIEQELVQQAATTSESDEVDQQFGSLQGKVAMDLGLELRRGYVNDMAVLDDGTCVSVVDDGHIQLWKHGAQQHDVIHQGNNDIPGGVDSVVSLPRTSQPQSEMSGLSFVTAGRGCLRLWTKEAHSIGALPTPLPGTSPASLVSMPFSDRDGAVICLAARLRITRQSNASQAFRLPPQNETERQRRAQAEAQEQAIQQTLDRASRTVQVWYSVGAAGEPLPSLTSQLLSPPDTDGSASVTCLVSFADPNADGSSAMLAVGDALGGVRLWRVHKAANRTLQFQEHGFYQLTSAWESQPMSCSIVCMQAIQGGRKLAVSTEGLTNPVSLHGAEPVSVSTPRAVHILDLSSDTSTSRVVVDRTLHGHPLDAVISMCELPNGDLLTGGGKMDATLQVWTKSQLVGQSMESNNPVDDVDRQVVVHTQSHMTLPHEVGYVFALKVLPDTKDGSNYYAVAVARYNRVKIIV